MKRLTLLLALLFVFVCGQVMAVDINPAAVDLEDANVYRAGPDRVYVTDIKYGDGSYSILLVYDKRDSALIYRPLGKEQQKIPASIDFSSSYISLTAMGLIEVGGIEYRGMMYSGLLKYAGNGVITLNSYRVGEKLAGRKSMAQEGVLRIEGYRIDLSKVDLSNARFALAGPDLLYLYGIRYGKMDVSGLLKYPGGTRLILTDFYTDDIFPRSLDLDDVQLVLLDETTLKVSGVRAYGKSYYGYLEYDGGMHLVAKPVSKEAMAIASAADTDAAAASADAGMAEEASDAERKPIDVSALLAELKELKIEVSLMYDLAADLAETVVWAREGLGESTRFIREGLETAERRNKQINAELKSNRKTLVEKVDMLSDAQNDLTVAIDFLRDDMVRLRDSFKPSSIAAGTSTDAGDRYSKGSKDVLEGMVTYYEGTSAEFNAQIDVDGTILPLTLSFPDSYIDKSVKLHVRYTGVGRRFDIDRIELVQ